MPKIYKTDEERRRARLESKSKWFYKSELRKWGVKFPDNIDFETLKELYRKNCETYRGVIEDTLHDVIKPINPQNKRKGFDISPFKTEGTIHRGGVFENGVGSLLFGIGGTEVDLDGKPIEKPEENSRKSSWKF